MKKIFTVLTLMLVMASFSSNAQQKDEAWLEYDNGVFMTDIGLLTGDPIYWGNMFTPSQLADFDGYQLIKVKIWDHTPYNGYLIIYQDNSETGPAEMVYMQQYSVEGTNDWTEIELNLTTLTANLPSRQPTIVAMLTAVGSRKTVVNGQMLQLWVCLLSLG